jgi:hypothetical protein
MRHLRTRPHRPRINGEAVPASYLQEKYPHHKCSGAEQLGDDEEGETKTGSSRFAVTVVGLGSGFHLVSIQ